MPVATAAAKASRRAGSTALMKVMFVVPSNFQYLQALRSERGKNLPLAILQPPCGPPPLSDGF